ncbi:MAG TPA: M57 family metalloprotease [Chryseosolibacter sp.]
MHQIKKLTIAMSIVAMFIIAPSCSDQELQPQQDNGVSDDVKAQFKQLGFDVSDIRLVSDANPLSSRFGAKDYILEGDIVITEENLQQMLGSGVHHVGPVGEQYRTTNLVSNNRTIRVLGYTGGTNALDTKMRTALQQAVDNYNALNIGLTFTLSFGTNTGANDIVVYRVSGSAGGQAGFPSGGNPYQWVQIFSGTSSYSTDVVEHVITHEIGHCLGLRHTDYFNRSLSCGSGGNEGSSGVGAIHVPGTPTGYDANSIMLSCFSSSENGEFGNYDRVALEYLY